MTETLTRQTRPGFITRTLEELGVPHADALAVAEVLEAADARGIEAHGIACLDAYVDGLRGGRIHPNPSRPVLRETATTIVIDGGRGLGPPAAKLAMSKVIDKARATGAAFGAVRNSHHFGIAAYYAMMALPHDMIGMASTNASREVLPTFGREALLGRNPMAFAVPANKEPAFVLDFATSATQRDESGALLPLGGLGTENGGHKGYGLGLLVDILCAVLAGGALGPELPAANNSPDQPGVSHFFGAFRIDGFRDPSAFKDDMDLFVRQYKDSDKAPGQSRIYVAGEPEWEKSAQGRTE